VLAKQRFVEFLPATFTLPNQRESMQSIVRRAFRWKASSTESAEYQKAAVASAFAFIKAFDQEHIELEILGHWMRLWAPQPQVPLESSTSAKRNVKKGKKSTPSRKKKGAGKSTSGDLTSTATSSAAADPNGRLSDWIAGASIISYGFQSVVARIGAPADVPPHRRSAATPVVPQPAATHPTSRTFIVGDSFTQFSERVQLQIEAILSKVRAVLLMQQLTAEEVGKMTPSQLQQLQSGGGKRKSKTCAAEVAGDANAVISCGSSDPAASAAERMTARVRQMTYTISFSQENTLMASVDVESIVRSIIRVFLEEMKFTAVTIAPLEGFLIDRVLETKVASTSMLSLIFAAVGNALGVQCSVTLDQRCPLVRVEGFQGSTCFVNLADGGAVLSPDEALEHQLKTLSQSSNAKTTLVAAEPTVVYCGILASLLVASKGVADAHGEWEGVKQLLKAQLVFLSQGVAK